MPSHKQAGFTLLEVLIAFVIAASALGVLFRAAGESAVSVAVAARYAEALSRAQSHLAAAEVERLVPGEQAGDDGGGFRYRVRTTALQSAPPLPNGVIPILFGIRVAVSWEEGAPRMVELDARRLGVAPQP